MRNTRQSLSGRNANTLRSVAQTNAWQRSSDFHRSASVVTIGNAEKVFSPSDQAIAKKFAKKNEFPKRGTQMTNTHVISNVLASQIDFGFGPMTCGSLLKAFALSFLVVATGEGFLCLFSLLLNVIYN